MVTGTMMQYFHWYYPADGNLWKQAKEKAQEIASMGITALWLPPAYKGKEGASTPGYDVYDLYELGEFDQKGSVRTKYGTKEEYVESVKALHEKGIQVIVDVVFNHKGGADEKERIKVFRVDPENRNIFWAARLTLMLTRNLISRAVPENIRSLFGITNVSPEWIMRTISRNQGFSVSPMNMAMVGKR